MIRLPPRATRTETLFPCTTRFRAQRFEQPAKRHGHTLVRASLVVLGKAGEQVVHLADRALQRRDHIGRSEEHTSELQSLMRISYAVFCLKKKSMIQHIHTINPLSRQHTLINNNSHALTRYNR